jgi:tetratricopeptide (TPR) repeat protein
MPGIPTPRYRRRRGLSTILALALLAAAVGPARAATADADAPPRDDEAGAPPEMRGEARALYDRGLALYRARDYANAVRAFEEGFALEPRGEFLFANAQSRRLAGDCRGAVPLYQRFLDMSPPAVQASATHIALARCARQMAAERPAAPAVIEPPPLPPPPPPPPWTHDRWGAALLGVGVVGLAVGGGFLAASFAALPDDGARTYVGYDGARSTAESRHAIAVGGLVAGGAFVAAGVARYAWVRHGRGARATLTVVPGGIALGGWFCALGGCF